MGESNIVRWCNRLIKLGFIAIFGLVPLLLTPLNYELFEYNKMMAVYIVTSIIVTSWIIKSLTQKEFRLAKTPLDIPIGLFVASQFISTLFSIDPHISWLGYYSRFNGGMWSVISYVLLYYAFLSNLDAFTSHANELGSMNHESWGKTKTQKLIPAFPIIYNSLFMLLKVALITTTLVALYGVLERLGIDKHLWVQDVQNRVFSTLGQPNWLAAYLVALIPLSMAFALERLTINNSQFTGIKRALNPKTLFFCLLSTLYFVTLLFTRSRSGLLGFVIGDILFWLSFIPKPRFMKVVDVSFKGSFIFPFKNEQQLHTVKFAGFLHILFAITLFLNGTGSPALDSWITWNGLKTKIMNTTLLRQDSGRQALEATPSAVVGPALEVGGTESGTIRKYVWQGAINAWQSSTKTTLIGTGTETFAFAFYEFRPVEHNVTSEWDFLYNKAHNEYLNYLATTGLFGLGSYLLFIGVFVTWFVGNLKTKNENLKSTATFEILTIKIALFAGWISILVTNFFGFSVVILQLFLFLFPAIIFALSPRNPILDTRYSLRLPSWTLWLPTIAGLLIVLRIASFWYADTLYARGYRLIRGGLFGQAIPALNTATAINSREPVYHDELGSAYATLATAAFDGGNATQAAQLAALSIRENTKALSTSPRNVNFYKTKTKIYYTLSSLNPEFNANAIEALKQAIPLSPNDPKIYYNLAILVGREGKSDEAIEYLKKAKALKPNYRDAYYALWVFYTEIKKPAEAKAILEEYLTRIDPNDKDFLNKVK